MRVTFLDPSGQMGGAERVLLDCIRVGDGFPDATISVLTLGAGPVVEAAQALGAHAIVVQPPVALRRMGDAFTSSGTVFSGLLPALWTFPAFFSRFSRAVARLAPQVIHSHGIKTHVLAALLVCRVPIVWHVHDYLGNRPVSSRLLRLLARRCTLAIAVSESVAQDARRCLPSRLPIVVVHNSVDCDRFCPQGTALDLDRLSGLPPSPIGTIRIGLPATFARWKGHEVFLDAIARLRRPDVRAYVIGGPVYETRDSQWSEAELRGHVKKLGLGNRVGFTGFVDDMPAAYRALDIVVHASTRPEPFGLAIVEGMACGRAVVAAPIGGASELFVPGEHALTAESGSADALAATLDCIVGDSDRRATLGARARAHVVERFGTDRFARGLRAALLPVWPGIPDTGH